MKVKIIFSIFFISSLQSFSQDLFKLLNQSNEINLSSCQFFSQDQVAPLAAVIISPAGPLTYYNQYETTNSITLTTSYQSENQWYRNGVAISGATGATLTIQFQGLQTYTDYYAVVHDVRTSNEVSFTYVGCDSYLDYPVSVPSSYYCATILPETLTAPNLGAGTTYSWWAYNNPSCYSFSNFSGNTCEVNNSGCTIYSEGVYSKSSLTNGTQTYMFYVISTNPNCRKANRGNTNPIVTNSQTTIRKAEITPVFSKARLIPNPANSQVTIGAASKIEGIEIYNMSGTMVKQLKTNRSKTILIKINDLLPGMCIPAKWLPALVQNTSNC